MDDGSTVLIEDHGEVRVITLNRPAKHNALTSAGFRELNNALRDAECSDGVSVVVLTGAGRSFCSGVDRDEPLPCDQFSVATNPFHPLVETTAAFPKPLLAAVRGVAIGMGMTMLAHVDLVFAGSDARFRAPFAALHMPPEAASSVLFPAILGPQLTARLLYLGEWLDADEAFAAGLVARVTSTESVLDETLAAARTIAELPTAVTGAIKRLHVEARRDAVNAALARERASAYRLLT
jgi:enoyl-CoA hydratase/carnithine racemase